MRALHVIPSIAEAHGGPSAAVAVMAEGLAARGVEVTIATTDDAGPGRRMSYDEQEARQAQFAENGVNLVFRPKRTEFCKISPGLSIWLWRNICKFDVAHIHALFSFASIAAGRIAAHRGIPYVLRPLGVLNRYGMTVRRPVLKRLSFAILDGPIVSQAAAVHFTSESEQDEAHALGRAMRPVLLPLGVRMPELSDPGGLIREIGAPADWPRVLYLSRIDPKKNLDGLLHALARLKADGATLPFLMVAGDGDPGYVASLKHLAHELGISGSTAWLGRVEGTKKGAVWAAADIFVLASHSENFGIAAAEAMLAGLPSLLGDGVGIAAEASAAGAACLTTIDPDDIAKHLSALIGNPGAASAMGERAKTFASARCSTKAMAASLEELYLDIIASSNCHISVSRANIPHMGK